MDTAHRSAVSSRARVGLLVAVLFAVLAPSVAYGQVDVPPVPEDKHYIQDNARVISSDAAGHIGDIQRTAAEQHHTQIVVVTIDSMAEYGGRGMAIEEFAKQWFNDWGIGIREGGKLYNRGILLLVSVDDRKARIELGAEWGRQWDDYCKRVMDNTVVPEFKDGSYSLGITQGVDALSKMAERGPSAEPPQPSTGRRWINEATRWTETTSYFSPETQAWMGGIGLVLLILSFFVNDQVTRRWLFWIGLGLIVLAVLTYVVMVIAALFGKNEGYSGGGGFGGGFSGGGGATGSW
ncbi:MAG: YgcG family protein [Bradymonadaceae bacterium]